ncbi:MAG: ATP-dependent helicase, partial [Desulfobacteraceae bacterium]|nr:ATP-dependent helicase [Desulfobacteraceae bacterium]
ARRGLYLVYPREIVQSGRFGEPAMISRFLEEMPPGFTISVGGHLAAPRVFAPQAAAGRKRLLSSSDLTGSRVRHPFFGEGRVTGMSGPRVALVFFDRHGSKSIHLDYAQMEVIGP